MGASSTSRQDASVTGAVAPRTPVTLASLAHALGRRYRFPATPNWHSIELTLSQGASGSGHSSPFEHLVSVPCPAFARGPEVAGRIPVDHHTGLPVTESTSRGVTARSVESTRLRSSATFESRWLSEPVFRCTAATPVVWCLPSWRTRTSGPGASIADRAAIAARATPTRPDATTRRVSWRPSHPFMIDAA